MVTNSHQECFNKVFLSSENAIFFKLNLLAVMNWFQLNTFGKVSQVLDRISSKEKRTSETPE